MRIHADTLTHRQIDTAARAAGVRFVRRNDHGSRTRDHAFDVILSGDSPYRVNGNPDEFAASWDQWGIFLASIFSADESVTITRVYRDADHFHMITGDRFETLTRADAHRLRRWTLKAPYVQSCTCGASRRWDF